MEQAATSSLANIFAQLGIGGLILTILIAGAAWWLKASKELRTEKRGVIEQLEDRITARDAQIEALKTERDQLTKDLLDCQYPERRQVNDDRP